MIFGDREDLCREVMYEMERQEGHAFRLELYFTLLYVCARASEHRFRLRNPT